MNYNFKQCTSEIGGAISSIGIPLFSGYGSEELIAVAQASKPSIHIYQWNKPQIQIHCHLQETVSICSFWTIYYLIQSFYCYSALLLHLLGSSSLQEQKRGIFIAGIRRQVTPMISRIDASKFKHFLHFYFSN